jgi:hypothetical protein
VFIAYPALFPRQRHHLGEKEFGRLMRHQPLLVLAKGRVVKTGSLKSMSRNQR